MPRSRQHARPSLAWPCCAARVVTTVVDHARNELGLDEVGQDGEKRSRRFVLMYFFLSAALPGRCRRMQRMAHDAVLCVRLLLCVAQEKSKTFIPISMKKVGDGLHAVHA